MKLTDRPILTTALALAALTSNAASTRAATYEIDNTHSFVVFEVGHLGVGTAHGRFNEMEGTFTIDPENPEKSSIDLTIDAGTVDTANERRDKHLRSPDFFDVKQFPALSFKSTSVTPIAAGDLEVTGNLTLHGVTRPVTVRAELVGEGKDPWGGFRRGYDARFTILRSDYGMSFMPGGIGDAVKITLSLEGIRR